MHSSGASGCDKSHAEIFASQLKFQGAKLLKNSGFTIGN